MLTLGALLSAGHPAAAQDVVTLHIGFDEVHDRILPFVQQTVTEVSLEAHLLANGDIQQSEARSSGRTHAETEKHLTLGRGQDRHRWHVVGQHQLLNVVDYVSYRRAILLTVAHGTCSASVDYKLKPGFHDYRYHRLTTGEPAVATAVRADNLVCSAG